MDQLGEDAQLQSRPPLHDNLAAYMLMRRTNSRPLCSAGQEDEQTAMDEELAACRSLNATGATEDYALGARALSLEYSVTTYSGVDKGPVGAVPSPLLGS